MGSNQWIATFLALLPTGWFGLHHYYLGNKRKTILYTLFIWTLIPILLAFIDGVRYLRWSKETFLDKYGEKHDQDIYRIQKLYEDNVITRNQAITMIDKIFENVDNEKIDEEIDIDYFEIKNKESDEENENKTNEKEKKLNYKINTETGEPDYSDYYGKW